MNTTLKFVPQVSPGTSSDVYTLWVKLHLAVQAIFGSAVHAEMPLGTRTVELVPTATAQLPLDAVTIVNIVLTFVNIVLTCFAIYHTFSRRTRSSVVEVQVGSGYPAFLKDNDLFKSAFDSLPEGHVARSSRTQFNKFFYFYCEVCKYNCFSYHHEERCHPQTTSGVLVQASLGSNLTPAQFRPLAQAGQTWTNSSALSPVPLARSFSGTAWRFANGSSDWHVRDSDGFLATTAKGTENITRSWFQDVITFTHLAPNTTTPTNYPQLAPTQLSTFERNGLSVVRDDTVPPEGTAQQVRRIRTDVRFIEEKLDVMWPILQRVLTATTSGSSGGGSVSTPGASTSIPTIAIPSTFPNVLDNQPLGDGGFPNTLEGQMARILVALRRSALQSGGQFQASLTKEQFDSWNSAAPFSLSIRPDEGTVSVLHRQTLPFHPLHRVAATTPPTIGFCIIPGGAILRVVWNNGRVNIAEPSAGSVPSTLSSTDFLSSLNSSGGSTAGLLPGNQADRVAAINVNLRTLMATSGVTNVVVVQAALTNSTLTIADVDQILEPATVTVKADAPMEEQLNELDSWTITNVLSRPTLIKRETWNTQADGTNFITAAFPNAWIDNVGRQTHFNNMLNAFTMMKANVVFRLVTNTTPMYGGILAMAFDFYGRLGSVEGSSLSKSTIANMDPVYLDISEGTVAELSVPFSAVSQYLSRQHAPFASQFMGAVKVVAMSDIYKAPLAAEVEMRLYAYVEAPRVAVLQDPDTRSYVVPQATLVKSITSFAHSFIPGMRDTYPLALEEGYHVTRESTCRVEDIAGVFGLVKSFKWNSSDTPEKELGAVNVHPMEHVFVPSSATAPSGPGKIFAPRLAHLGRHFSYWNGTLEYKIEVACSKSHAGKMHIVFQSGPDFRVPASTSIENNAHMLLDVQLQHELTFTVPFASPTPWKPTFLSHPFADILATRTGRVVFYNADGIKSALSTTSSITVNVYVRAMPDFQYAVPRNGLQGSVSHGEVLAQNSLTSLRPVLKMNSEDFNDLYKVLRRFTSLGAPVRSTNSSTLVIPVRPLIPQDTELNSISTVAQGFSFWRGSLSYKFKIVDVSVNRASFEIFHIPTMGMPEGIKSYSVWTDPITDALGFVEDKSKSGSFYGSQTFHGEIDKEFEVTVPYYSMYDHLHIPLKHYAGAPGSVAEKLPLLSTNNGCLIMRPLRGPSDGIIPSYSLAVSVSCGVDFSLLAPTAFPPIDSKTSFRKDFKVVAQGALDPPPTPSVQGLLDMYKNLDTVLEAFKSLSTRLDEDSAEGTQNYFAGIIETAVKNLVAQAKLSLSGWLKEILPDVDWRLIASSSIAAFLVYSLRDQISSSIGKIVLGALATLVSHKVLKKLSDFVEAFMGPQIRVQVGAGFDVSTITQLLCGVVAVLLNMDFKKGITGFVKNLGEMGKSLSGVKSGLDAIRVFSSFVSDNIVPSLGDDDALTLRGLMNESVDILDEVYSLNLEEMRVACLTQKDVKQRVLTCDGRLQELNRLVLLNPCSPAIIQSLRAAMTKMDKLRTEVMAYKGEDGYRLDPFHISIYGPPGIGKSAMMEKLNNDLIVYNDLPRTNTTYTRSPENVYWDNYKGQTTTMFDDLGQIAAVAPPSDLSELISLKSNAPYMVHMASIAEKGTYFTSTFLISSTNFKLYNDCTFVKEKAALHRRRNALVEMSLADGLERPEFERGLDGPNAYAKFRILNSLTAEPESEWMTFDRLTVILCERSRVYLADQNALVARQHGARAASPAIQALLAQQGDGPVIPGVVADGEFIPTAEAQGLLDSLTPENRTKMIERWTQHFRNAWHWRDYGALTSGFPTVSRHSIATAIRLKSAAGLSRSEKVIYNCWYQSQVEQKRAADILENARSNINQIGSYFHDLYTNLPKPRKQQMATALALTGATGLGYALWLMWQRPSGSEVSNIPLEVFTEAEDSYQSKIRPTTVRKSVVVESGVDDHVTKRGNVKRIMIESGKDDHVTKRGGRRILVEGSADFIAWAKANPGLIPYKNILDEENYKPSLFKPSTWTPKVLGPNQAWIDYDDYCTEQGHPDRYTIPALPEGSVNPMVADVPAEIMSLSEDQLVSAMQTLNDGKDLDLETIRTDTTSYQIASPQYTTDQDCSLFIKTTLVDNIGLIVHEKSGFRMRCIAVSDRFIVLPKHFFLLTQANWKEDDLFKIWLKGNIYEQKFTFRNLELSPKRDLCVYNLSVRVTGARDIRNRIATASDHAAYRSADGSLVSVCAERGKTVYINQHHLPVISPMTTADHARIQYPIGKATHILKGYSYAADTQNGDCGSVLLQHNVRTNAKILGLHVAAITEVTRAFSELLVREEVDSMIDSLTERTGYITTGNVGQTVELARRHNIMVQGLQSNQFQHLNDNVNIIDNVRSDLLKRTPTKTEIKPSPLAGHIDIQAKTEPAVLTPSDPRCTSGIDPLINTVGGYGLESKPFSPSHGRLVVEYMISKLRKYDGYIGRRTLSLKEAINGIPGVDYADSMNMNSAEGSFWNLNRPFWAHNKSWMFENLAAPGERADYKINMESGLLQKLVHRLKEAMAGRRVLSVTSENLKDERRPLKKTRPPENATEEELKEFTPNTRSFSILPVDYNILVREYFWDFSAMIMKHRGELGPQVGINPCSIEWTALMKRLLATSTMGFAGDFKNYDRQTPAEFMDMSCDIINGWYDDGPVNAQIRKVLMGEAFDRLTIVRGVFLHIDKGLPSGFPLTVIVNSLNNDIYKYYAWLAITTGEFVPKLLMDSEKRKDLTPFIPLEKCDNHTDSAYYGDDNLHAVDPEVSDFFNMRTYGEFLEQHNVMLTDEDKNHWSTAAPLVPMESVSFLKRLFVPYPHSGFYLAPLEKRSIEDRLLWITDSKYMSDAELLHENIQNSLRDAFHWGPGYFCELKTKIDNAISEVYPDPVMRRRMMSDITFGGEELQWIQTCKGVGNPQNDPILGDVFGF